MARASNVDEPRGRTPILPRHRHLLSLLHALGGSVPNLDFQLLLFLSCQDPTSNKPYDFVPHRSGPFSFTAQADRRKLTDRAYLAPDDHHWVLTDEGRDAISEPPDLLSASVSAFARAFHALRGDALLAETYRRFPYYATRSELAHRVLADDPVALEQIVAARPAGNGTPVSTIGYEGHTLESYLNALLRSGVTLLCDVRRNPLSRKFGFSKTTLANACEAVGLRYEHLPELGIASEQRRSLKTQADYDVLFAEYERTDLPKQPDALAKIASWVRSGEQIALTCYEHLPEQCHRHCVAEALEGKLGKGFAARHL